MVYISLYHDYFNFDLSPIEDDVLKARLKTTGVVEHTFSLPKNHEFRGVEWKIYDVGGSRRQRQAWAPYFDDGESYIDPMHLYCDIRKRESLHLTATLSCSERDHLSCPNQCFRPGSCRGALLTSVKRTSS